MIDDIPFIFNWIQTLLEILDTLCKSIVMNFKDFDEFAQVHFQEENQKQLARFLILFLFLHQNILTMNLNTACLG